MDKFCFANSLHMFQTRALWCCFLAYLECLGVRCDDTISTKTILKSSLFACKANSNNYISCPNVYCIWNMCTYYKNLFMNPLYMIHEHSCTPLSKKQLPHWFTYNPSVWVRCKLWFQVLQEHQWLGNQAPPNFRESKKFSSWSTQMPHTHHISPSKIPILT